MTENISEKEKFHILENMTQNELEDAEILKFSGINELFEYLYDEYTSKEDLIADMTADMKRQIVQNHYSERVIENSGEYFYSSEFDNVDFEELSTNQEDNEISIQ